MRYKKIRSEMYTLTQEKDVQHMLLLEKYEKMDWRVTERKRGVKASLKARVIS